MGVCKPEYVRTRNVSMQHATRLGEEKVLEDQGLSQSVTTATVIMIKTVALAATLL